MKLFFLPFLVFIPSIDQWQMQVLQSIFSFVRFLYRFLYFITNMYVGYKYTISKLWLQVICILLMTSAENMLPINQFFFISCNVEYISCMMIYKKEIPISCIFDTHIFTWNVKLLGSITICNVLKMYFFLWLLIVRISEMIAHGKYWYDAVS